MRNETEPKRVLVVDDDHDFVQTLERYLKVAGYEVSCAYGGMGALEEIRVGNPAAVILDVMMPDIDGRRIVRYIREKMGDKKTAVIVLSALYRPQLAHQPHDRRCQRLPHEAVRPGAHIQECRALHLRGSRGGRRREHGEEASSLPRLHLCNHPGRTGVCMKHCWGQTP